MKPTMQQRVVPDEFATEAQANAACSAMTDVGGIQVVEFEGKFYLVYGED